MASGKWDISGIALILDIWFLFLSDGHSYCVSVALGQRNKTQPQKPQFNSQEGRTHTRQLFWYCELLVGHHWGERCSAYLCLFLRLKFRSAIGASHYPAFTGNCQTISHTLHSLCTQWMERMRCEVSPLSRVTARSWKIKIRNRKCVAWLQRSEISVAWYFISLTSGFCSCRMTAVTMYPWPNGQRSKTQPQKPQFKS